MTLAEAIAVCEKELARHESLQSQWDMEGVQQGDRIYAVLVRKIESLRLMIAAARQSTETTPTRNRPWQHWELMCLCLIRQLTRDNPTRKRAESFIAAHGSGIDGTLRGDDEYPAPDFGVLHRSPTDESTPPTEHGSLKGSPLDELPNNACGRRCQKCGGMIIHHRLKGYRCFACD